MNRFSANASLMGYLYQARYALYLLITAEEDDCCLSIERFDDVSFERGGSPIQLIQTKNVGREASLSDSSPDLWKTIRIWVTDYATGETRQPSTLYTIITTGSAPDGSVASMLRPNPQRPLDVAVDVLRRVASVSKSKKNKASYQTFMGLAREQQRDLLSRVVVLDASPSIHDVRDLVLRELEWSARPEHAEPFLERLEGWWLRKVIEHLAHASQESIQKAELRNRVLDIADQFHRDNLPVDFPMPVEENEASIAPDQRVFLEQLNLIAARDPWIKRAISDYYRAYQQRSKWVRDELIFIGELETYERSLVDEWERKFDMMVDALGESPSEPEKQARGRELFTQVDSQDIKIRERFTGRYFMRGSYQMLANRLEVGWHADFVERLQELLSHRGGQA